MKGQKVGARAGTEDQSDAIARIPRTLEKYKEGGMPPSSVYIGRTTEKRYRGGGAVWFWAVAACVVLAVAIILVVA